MSIWIVVADASRARIFSAKNRNGNLDEVAGFLHSASRQKGRDLESDAQGRAFDSGGQGRHAMGKESSYSEHEAEVFARELCAEIDQACHSDRFEKLYLIATPRFLGHLRTHLGGQAKKRVAGEVTKDVVNHASDDIRQQLPDFL